MSLVGLLDRGYTLIWREGRLEDALHGLGDDFEWVVPDHPEGAVLATIDMRGRGSGSGVPTEMRFFQLWTVRDGRAVRMEMFSDLDEARRTAGLGP